VFKGEDSEYKGKLYMNDAGKLYLQDQATEIRFFFSQSSDPLSVLSQVEFSSNIAVALGI
jgi:hypothetical protein